jgi:hypothetical protein
VGHAGTSTIFTGRKYGVPIIIMPRIVEFNEHRNGQQRSTVEVFKNVRGVYVAEDKESLFDYLDNIDNIDNLLCPIYEDSDAELPLRSYLLNCIITSSELKQNKADLALYSNLIGKVVNEIFSDRRSWLYR